MSDLGERLREGFDANDVSTYLELIQKWRDDLRDMATGALQMQGIEETERDNLKRALNSLGSIGELVKIIGELPYAHAQAHALGQLWGIIGAAFVIGSHAVKNPIIGKTQTKQANKTKIARSQLIVKISIPHVRSLWQKKSKRRASLDGTAREILANVNEDLKRTGQKPTTSRAIRGLMHEIESAL